MDSIEALERWVEAISVADEYTGLMETNVSRLIAHWGGVQWNQIVRSDRGRRWIRFGTAGFGSRRPAEEITTDHRSWYVLDVGPITLLARERDAREPRTAPPPLTGTVIGWLHFGIDDPWSQIAAAYAREALGAFSVAPALSNTVLEELRVAHEGFATVLGNAFASKLEKHDLLPTTCRQLWFDRYTNRLTEISEFRDLLGALAELSIELSPPGTIAVALQDSISPGLSRPSEIHEDPAGLLVISEEICGTSSTWSELPVPDPEVVMANWLREPEIITLETDRFSIESLMLLALASDISGEEAAEWEEELTVLRSFPAAVVHPALHASLEWLSHEASERPSRGLAFEWGVMASSWVSFTIARIRPGYWVILGAPLEAAHGNPFPRLLGCVRSPAHGRQIASLLVSDPEYDSNWALNSESPPTIWSDLPPGAVSGIRAAFQL